MSSVCRNNKVSILIVYLFVVLGQLTAEENVDYEYEVINDTITITRYIGSDEIVNIPSTIDDKPVTVIGDSAFHWLPDLSSVTIPASVLRVGNTTFGWCYELNEVNVDPGNRCYSSIDGVLFDKTQVELISCPGGKIGNYNIPPGVVKIGDFAFQACVWLERIGIPVSVIEIGDAPFAWCNDLQEIAVDPANSVFSSFEGSLFSKSASKLIALASGYHGDYVIPDGVVEIGRSAFIGCVSLDRVVIPSSVLYIGKETFLWCYSLTHIEVNVENPNYSSLDGVLFNKQQTILYDYPCGRIGDYVIPDTVTRIFESAFVDSDDLTNIVIPQSVTEIDSNAFFLCSGLTTVTIPSSISSINNTVFNECDSLVEVIIPSSVKNIKYSSFENCTSLRSLTIPASVENIESYAFRNCSSLTSVFFEGSAPFMGEEVFHNTSDVFVLYYLEQNPGFTVPVWMGYPASLYHPNPITLGSEQFVVGPDEITYPLGLTASIVWTITKSCDWLIVDSYTGIGSQILNITVPRNPTFEQRSGTLFIENKTHTVVQEASDFSLINEAVEAPELIFTSSGNVKWFYQNDITHGSVDAMQSGPIGDEEVSIISTSLHTAGALYFWWRVSSELDYDFLELLMDGEIVQRISGETDWERIRVTIPAGGATISWRYTKDFSQSDNFDAGWLDHVTFVEHWY